MAWAMTLAVPGVARMGSVPGGVNRWFRRGIADGVQIQVADNTVTAALHLVVTAGENVREVSHNVQAEVRRAGEAILREAGKTENDRIRPEILSSTVIRHLDDRQTQLINRTRHGHMILAGQSLYTLEVQPAANAALAANEAEKAARIKVLEIVSFGSLGRVYLAGEDRDIDVAWPAAENAIRGLPGRAGK